MEVGLVGDYDDDVIAHRAIPLALKLSASILNLDIHIRKIATADVDRDTLSTCDALWCIPASPYKNIHGALRAIQFARENNIPFLGTCGGYQHAALEYARNMLGYPEADITEINPDTEMPLVTALTCKLVEKSESILLSAGSTIQRIYQRNEVFEDYHCSYGVNRDYLDIFEGSDMKFVGFDNAGEPKALEITIHPFFIGTAYQPERWVLQDRAHPLITEFLDVSSSNK